MIAAGQARSFATKAVPVAAPAEGIRIASAFNRALLGERLFKDSVCSLASPVLGNGVAIDLVQGLLLLGHDAAGPDGAVEHAMERIQESGASWRMQGQAVDDPAAMRGILEDKLEEFHQTSAPLLQRLGIVEAA